MNASARRTKDILWFAGFVASYWLAYRFGMSFGHQSPSPFWMPDSVLIAALLRSQPKHWSLLVAVTLPIRLGQGVFMGLPPAFLTETFAIDGVRCIIDAYILRRVLINPVRLTTLYEFIVFVVVVCFGVPFICAFGGAALVSARGHPYWPAWVEWFLGDTAAQLIVTPFILYWVFDPAWLRFRLDPQRTLEACVAFAGLAIGGSLAAYMHPSSAYYSETRFYAPLPFLLWASIRFGMPGATGALAVLAFFVVQAAIGGYGPYAGRAPLDVAIALQNYLVMRALPFLFVAMATEQRWRAEQALRESEERFRRMAESAPVLLWMSGADKLCTFFNRGWLAFTGRTLEQETGNGWTEGVHPGDVAHCVACYETAFDARETFELEYRLRRYDGEYRWILDIGTPRYAPDGEFAGYIGSAIDITDRKRSEEMRQALAHTQRLAVMGELTAAIAHEVRQPMSAILLDAQTAEKLATNENLSPGFMREIASAIRINAARVDTVMSRILGYLRKQDPQPKLLDVNAVVHGVLQLVAGDAMRRSVQLRPELGRNLPFVLADRTQLEQVLLNLVVNGMEAMESIAETARQITVRTVAPGNGNIEVTVSDCGTGIAPDKLPLLFDSFFTTRKEGMGLGLSIAKSIVVAHHGRIWAENNRSSGATFHFTLPVSNDDARAQAG
ncbi:MAG TPA: ATP-binding protein [Rhizomicrobium sp.]|nr:ATP-binding protein [Rhizomicrobium sp.]